MLLITLCAWPLAGCQEFASGQRMEVVKSECARDSEAAGRHHRHGVHALRKGRPEHAEEAFRKALKADDEYAPAHNNLGLLYYDRRDLPAAACSFQRAIDLKPDRPEPWNNLGLTFEAAGKLDEAIRAFDSAHKLAPGDPNYLGNLVRARLERGDPGPQVRPLLEQLVFVDTRPEWIHWAHDQLALFVHKQRASSDAANSSSGASPEPETVPTPPPLKTTP